MKLNGHGKILLLYDKALMKCFGDFKTYDSNGKSSDVSILYGSEERLGEIPSSTIVLPLVSLYRTSVYKAASRWWLDYQLTFRTTLSQDMDQLLEQLMIRFIPHANIAVEHLGNIELNIQRLDIKDTSKVHRYDFTISTEVL